MSTMQYQLHLNPQQTAALKIAISFWERKEVKDKAARFFRSSDEFFTRELRWKWSEFTGTILDEWIKDLLPKKIKAKLIHIIKMMAVKIFDWYQIINLKYTTGEELINYIEEIKWTPYGTVDEVETFKSYLLDNSYFHTAKVYNFACHRAIDDHIDNLWNKIPSHIQDDLYDNYIYHSNNKHILAYWKHRRDNNLSNFMGYLQDAVNNFDTEDRRVFNTIYDLNHSIGENMLRISVHQGYFSATKYFWAKLTEEERDNSVVKSARIALTGYNCYYNFLGIEHMRNQYVEICIFLMNQMSKDHKKTFFNGMIRLDDLFFAQDVDIKDLILEMLVSTWPWQELFLPVLKDMIQCRDNDNDMDYRFLEVITDKMWENYELGYSIETDKYRYLLRQAWIIIPASIKQKMIQFDAMSFVVHNLIKMWDLDSFHLIINDPEITANVRDRFIRIGSTTCCRLIEEDKFEKLNQFIQKILRSEDEKKEFKQKFQILRDLIKEGKFELADKQLDWQSSTPEERQTLKNEIDHIKMCEYFIRYNDYELLNKFLDWKLNTEEEKRKCKDHFKNNPVSIKLICEKWKGFNAYINSAKNECSLFLHWLFESEEGIAVFKKEMAVNFENRKSNIIDFTDLKRMGVLDDFISWCLLDDEHLQLTQRMNQPVVQSN